MSVSPYIPTDTTMKFMVWRKRYLPEHTNVTPVSHYRMLDYYVDTVEDGFGMIQCHRGLGKTQLAMEFSLFCICEGIEQYVLFVGGTQDLTNDIVGSASDLAYEIPYIKVKRAVEGVLEIVDKNGNEAFLVAKSTGSKLRGIAKGKLRQRPTAIVLDDVVSDDLVMNRLRMDRANRWMTSALFPTLVPGGKVFGSGTPMHSNDPFMKLCNTFGSFDIPLSSSSFPDRFTEEFIENKKKQYVDLGQFRDWKREFELVLADSDTQLFDMNKVGFVTEDEVPEGLEWYMTVDAAISTSSSADYSALTAIGVGSNGIWYVYPYQSKLKPSELSGEICRLASMFSINEVGIEQGATFLAVIEHLDQMMLDYQMYFSVSELKHGGVNKHSRIKSLEPVVNAGRLRIIDVGEHSEALVEQMELTDLETCSAIHDDLLDALAYGTKLVPNTYVSPMTGVDMGSSAYI